MGYRHGVYIFYNSLEDVILSGKVYEIGGVIYLSSRVANSDSSL